MSLRTRQSMAESARVPAAFFILSSKSCFSSSRSLVPSSSFVRFFSSFKRFDAINSLNLVTSCLVGLSLDRPCRLLRSLGRLGLLSRNLGQSLGFLADGLAGQRELVVCEPE